MAEKRNALGSPRRAVAGGRPGAPVEDSGCGRGRQTPPPTVEVQPPSRCPKCGSTDRSDYWGRQVQEFAGVLADGRPYGRIVRRRCRCLACGQVRIDKTFEP